MLISSEMLATHQRSAEITYRHIENLTYEFTITMYTYTPSLADDSRTYLTIQWGDNTFDDIPRVVFQDLDNNYTLNVYRMNHTYSGNGNYIISVEDANRNFGVINITNSVNVPMYVETELIINPFLGNNNSAQLLNAPVDQACVGKLYLHNPSAYDPDNDSLSYKLINCKGTYGEDIPGYELPMSSNYFTIDSVTGELRWDSPILQGEYNVAFMIEEWRQGVKIGSVIRDMQILVGACSNNPPEIDCITDTCVIAGDMLIFDIISTDEDGNGVSLTASGSPFEQATNPASIIPNPATGTPTAQTTFYWETHCFHVKKNNYQALFRAVDNHYEINLTNLKTVNITVIAPPIHNLTAEPLGNTVILNWSNDSLCSNAQKLNIYRRNGYSGFVPEYCETGVPEYTGYQLIATLDNIFETSFTDDNNGSGLSPGIEHCYLITSVFHDGAESKASNEACAVLKNDLPLLTHVSNDSLNLHSGQILTAWSKPTELDTIAYPGPYQYKLTRNNDLIFTGFGLNDTLFNDVNININEEENPIHYVVELHSESIGYIGSSPEAQSIDLQIISSDKKLILEWTAQVSWINDSFDIFRRNPNETDFQYIGSTNTYEFQDTGLTNDLEYAYYIRSVGKYSLPHIVKPIINYSAIRSGIPSDNLAPLPPILTVVTDCETVENTLSWTNPTNDSIEFDVMGYCIYYTPNTSVDFVLIDSVSFASDSSFIHTNIDFVIGCYYVTAFDDNGNISEKSNISCIDYDDCPIYKLPNVFTPNGDQYNDLFQPIDYPSTNPKAVIQRIDLKIFSRWGKIIFETDNPEINWDGKDKNTNQDCAAGTYFYVCEIYFESIDGLTNQRLQGSVAIVR